MCCLVDVGGRLATLIISKNSDSTTSHHIFRYVTFYGTIAYFIKSKLSLFLLDEWDPSKSLFKLHYLFITQS